MIAGWFQRLLAVGLLACLRIPPAGAEEADPVERGAYLVRAAGCASCHTDEKGGGSPFAGGRALETPFGTVYSPNITADAATGIGGSGSVNPSADNLDSVSLITSPPCTTGV